MFRVLIQFVGGAEVNAKTARFDSVMKNLANTLNRHGSVIPSNIAPTILDAVNLAKARYESIIELFND